MEITGNVSLRLIDPRDSHISDVWMLLHPLYPHPDERLITTSLAKQTEHDFPPPYQMPLLVEDDDSEPEEDLESLDPQPIPTEIIPPTDFSALSRPQGQRESPAGHVLRIARQQIQNVQNTQHKPKNNLPYA